MCFIILQFINFKRLKVKTNRFKSKEKVNADRKLSPGLIEQIELIYFC